MDFFPQGFQPVHLLTEANAPASTRTGRTMVLQFDPPIPGSEFHSRTPSSQSAVFIALPEPQANADVRESQAVRPMIPGRIALAAIAAVFAVVPIALLARACVAQLRGRRAVSVAIPDE